MATGYVLGVPYELAHQVPAARRAGVTEEQLAAVPGWQTAPEGVFDLVERAGLAYADEVARTRSASPEHSRRSRVCSRPPSSSISS